jgi:hypothetical protein
MNTALEYSTRVVQEGGRRCKKSSLNDLVHLTPLRIPLMNPPYLCAAGRPSCVAETSTCGSTTTRRKCASSTQGDPPLSFTRPTRSPSKPTENALPASPQRTFCRRKVDEIAQRQFSPSPLAGCVALQSPAALRSNPLTDGKRNWRLACSRGFSDLRRSLAGRETRPLAGNSIAGERESKM